MIAPASDPACERIIRDLLVRMTADEKIGQLTWIPAPESRESTDWEELEQQIAAGRVGAVIGTGDCGQAERLQSIAQDRSRLAIPLLLPLDVGNGIDTIMPAPPALAASWDTEAVEGAAAVIASEAREHGANWLHSSDLSSSWLVELASQDRSTGRHLAGQIVRAFVSGLHDTDCPSRVTWPFAPWPFAQGDCAREAYGREIQPDRIDEAVAQVLRLKTGLGLIGKTPVPAVCRASHSLPTPVHNREVALDLARKCAVLLRNDPRLLPLGIDSGEILVVGAAATDRHAPLAGKQGVAASVIDGLEQLGIPHRFVAGLALRETGEASGPMRAADPMAIAMASEAAKRAGTVIFVHASHEEGGLSEADAALLDALVTANPRVAMVTLGHAPLDPSVDGHSLPTVLHAGQLGTMSGHAIAELLTGEASPSGRLPAALSPRGGDAELPFGHGLSYSEVTLRNLIVDSGPDRIGLTCELENLGDRFGSETVQVYLGPLEETDDSPASNSLHLVALRKMWFDPGEREFLHFDLGCAEFRFHADDAGIPVRHGRYCLRVGLNAKLALEREIVLTRTLASAMERPDTDPSPLALHREA